MKLYLPVEVSGDEEGLGEDEEEQQDLLFLDCARWIFRHLFRYKNMIKCIMLQTKPGMKLNR